MDSLLARFFDGDLEEHEAKAFLEAVESDPKLENELRVYERVLALGKKLPDPQAPAGFTGRVMAEVTARGHGVPARWRGRARFPIRWPSIAVAAAAVVLAFFGGWWIGFDPSGVPGTPYDSRTQPGEATTAVAPAFVNQGPTAGGGFRYVRLAYVPADPSVERVAVAGSFNDWDPNTAPLRRQDGVWRTILVLPPGSYEYMFVIDGQRWVTDPLAAGTRDDGFGGVNAVLDVEL